MNSQLEAIGRLLKLCVGIWRSWAGLCPECNCDAPACDTCPVCEDWANRNRGEGWPPPDEVQEQWWKRFRAMLAGQDDHGSRGDFNDAADLTLWEEYRDLIIVGALGFFIGITLTLWIV